MSDFVYGTGEYYVARCWQAGDSLAFAFDHQLRHSRGKPLSAGQCVALWRSFRAQVGYNGMLPMHRKNFKNEMDGRQLQHHGLKDLGAKLKGIIKEVRLLPRFSAS